MIEKVLCIKFTIVVGGALHNAMKDLVCEEFFFFLNNLNLKFYFNVCLPNCIWCRRPEIQYTWICCLDPLKFTSLALERLPKCQWLAHGQMSNVSHHFCAHKHKPTSTDLLCLIKILHIQLKQKPQNSPRMWPTVELEQEWRRSPVFWMTATFLVTAQDSLLPTRFWENTLNMYELPMMRSDTVAFSRW